MLPEAAGRGQHFQARGSVKREKNRRSPLVHSRKLAEHDNFTRAVSRRYRDRGQEIGKYCPLPEPIRLQDSQDTARSRLKK